ncbi:MAG TPA: response regulator transcription factor, partial [Verrucomicrobiae bacterium]|nr:response regulator transcription factor [Verrucomicrobiae bacterium]
MRKITKIPENSIANSGYAAESLDFTFSMVQFHIALEVNNNWIAVGSTQHTQTTMQISVSIVEDDVKVRGSLARLIDSTDHFSCVSQHPDAENALREIPVIKPEIVLMDINLPGMDGVECVRRLKQMLPQTQIVMLTVYENTNIIFAALTAGASGYLLKRSSPEQIVEAIRDVHNGGSPMSSHIARKVVASFQKVTNPVHEYEKLSAREQQVLDFLAKGFLYREIADELKISYATVHTHIRHIYEKLQ